MRGLSRAPKLFQHFLEANMGRRRPWALPIRQIPRFLVGLAFPKFETTQRTPVSDGTPHLDESQNTVGPFTELAQ